MRALAVIPFLFGSFGLLAQPSAATVANLVHEQDLAILDTSLAEALTAPEALVRATAARVVAVRRATTRLRHVSDALANESDGVAAREQIRTLALLGTEADVAIAAAAAATWPAGMDEALAQAVARRGGTDALELYGTHLRDTRMTSHEAFYRTALWGRTEAVTLAGARLIASADADGWKGLLAALRQSNAAMPGPMMVASLGSASEPIRSASVWYLVNGYATGPESIHPLVRESLAAPRPDASPDREDFGREILRRMLGGEKANDARWLKFLDTEEGDALSLGAAVQSYLTEEEYAVLFQRCKVQSRDCRMEPKRSPFRIPSTRVDPMAFDLPSALPPGLANAILAGERCNDSWIGVAGASVDTAGRVRHLDMDKVQTSKSCRRALDTILRLSMATNTSMLSELKGPVLLVREARVDPCLDEDEPSEIDSGTHRVGGEIEAPRITKRVEPRFPANTRRMMGRGREVLIVVDSVIAKSGCVRNLRILEQSPYAELNGAALMALSQWKFLPGRLNGHPVDTQFNLTISFKTH